MEQPLTYLKKRAGDNWLIGYDTSQFTQIAEELYSEWSQLFNLEPPPKIILSERNPVRFLAGFIAAASAGCPVFLCNPDWVQAEWQQVFDLVQPDIISSSESGEQVSRGDAENFSHSSLKTQNSKLPDSSLIMIPTGGSSGKIKFAIHTWETLITSVQGFQEYFQLDKVNSFCVLPLYHVSGLMQFLRSFTSGGKLAIAPFKAIESSENIDIEPEEYFISLVPTQLQRILQNPELTAWLSRFQTVLLGGAPATIELLEQARRHNIRLAPTYGMTETASQIATLKPEAFLAGNNSCGQILPHAKVNIINESGDILGKNQTGNLIIKADSLALGYYPDLSVVNNENKQINFQTDDLGYFDDRSNLNIVGRNSNKIVTGGENVFPAEVEAAILATNLVADVCAIGLPDRQWGQAVTAVYVPSHPEVDPDTLQRAIADKLSKFKRPKYWVKVESLPRNSQGKVNYGQVRKIAIACQQTHPNLPTNP